MLWLWLACNPSYPPDLPLDPEYTACDAPGDCVLVELGRCDHCNGGVVVSVNADSEEAVRRRYSDRRWTYSCTEMSCTPIEATCEAETCAFAPADTGT